MRFSCIVTNYNYGIYINDCLTSLASQTKQFDQIIIIDDGSTDNSRDIIKDFCQQHGNATHIFKTNGGQLSCFNAACRLIEANDFVFFLDSDDIYPDDYLEKTSEFITKTDAEFIFTKPHQFSDEKTLMKSSCNSSERNHLFHSTSALTRATHCWIGDVTSCLCIRGSLYHAIFPFPHEKDWITRADDIIVFGSSILGSHKLYIRSLSVNYRMHSNNNFAGVDISAEEKVDLRLRYERLFEWFSHKSGVPRWPSLKNALHESLIIPVPLRRQLGIPSPTNIFLFKLLAFAPPIKIILKDIIRPKQL